MGNSLTGCLRHDLSRGFGIDLKPAGDLGQLPHPLRDLYHAETAPRPVARPQLAEFLIVHVELCPQLLLQLERARLIRLTDGT